jgi:hypothetical protein
MTADIQHQLADQRDLVRALQTAVYSLDNPAQDEGLHRRLLQAEDRLIQLENMAAISPTEPTSDRKPPASHGRFLGPKTTGLRVEPSLKMNPLPTAIYNFLDPETDPLLTVVVANESGDPRRVCIKAYLEGLSAQAVRTVEIDPRQKATLNLLPVLLPERARELNEVQRATLHVIAQDLDGRPESHDTFSVTCLSRNSSFNAARRPGAAPDDAWVDLTHYYGAWVTPYNEDVQKVIREAARQRPGGQMWGYQGGPESVPSQVEALYSALKATGIGYVNSVIDYGMLSGFSTQRTRLPRESLALKSANCIDGAVLFASLLEGASLSAAIVLVPGHAFVAWETWRSSGSWAFLETTMVEKHEFADACQSGHQQFDQAKAYSNLRVTMHKLADLRARGIWPME